MENQCSVLLIEENCFYRTGTSGRKRVYGLRFDFHSRGKERPGVENATGQAGRPGDSWLRLVFLPGPVSYG